MEDAHPAGRPKANHASPDRLRRLAVRGRGRIIAAATLALTVAALVVGYVAANAGPTGWSAPPRPPADEGLGGAPTPSPRGEQGVGPRESSAPGRSVPPS
ncbi:MAG TPA: hypothetical protein VHN18_03420, partial [Micromonosporaceae bacterium]|nr:hypothetical protein [Micromonosporaceae bacterium]